MEKYLNNFLENISELMIKSNLSNRGLAEKISCSPTTIGNWLQKKHYPSRTTLINLSNYFNCSIDYLFGISENKDIPLYTQATFSERFSACMSNKDITEYKLAKNLGIEQSTISKWKLHGRIPDTETIIKLSEIFNCSLDYLLRF